MRPELEKSKLVATDASLFTSITALPTTTAAAPAAVMTIVFCTNLGKGRGPPEQNAFVRQR